MSELLLKMAMLAALTHVIRAVARVAGPRRGSLLLGLPSTTAIALVSCGQTYGISGAAEMAEASLFGLIAAVALALAFAHALIARRQLAWAAAAAVAAYLAVASASWMVPETGPVGRVLIATAAVLTACRQAERMGGIPADRRTPGPGGVSPARCLALRTLVPVACLAVITLLRESAGIRWAGLLSTFPGMTLAVLIVTYLESGPSEASRMARSLPSANLGMIAFVTAFRFGCPTVGLGWGTALGYMLAAVTLLAVGGWIQPPGAGAHVRTRWVRLATSARLRRVAVEPALWIAARRRRLQARSRGARPSTRRRVSRLSPLVEPIGL